MAYDVEKIKAGLGQFTGTSGWYRFSPITRNILLTDGSQYVAEACNAFWLMDVIASYQFRSEVRKMEFQVWKFKRGEPHTVTMTDGDSDTPIITQEIDYSDFPLDEITFYVEGGKEKVILLPSEH